MNNDELKKNIVNEINKCQLFGGRFGYRGELIKFPNELLADALIAAGATIREKAKWLWDDEDDAPKCSLCGKRAMYQPKQYGNGAKVCFITLSLYCPHCGAEMKGDICEEDTEEWREQEDLNPFKHALVKQARWWRWKAEALEKESEQLKSENAILRKKTSVTERALKDMAADYWGVESFCHGCSESRCRESCGEKYLVYDEEDAVSCLFKNFLEQAKKELTEEKKDD